MPREGAPLVDLLCRKAKIKIQIREMTFDFEAWTNALSVNRSLEDVTISVHLPSLGTLRVIEDFFQAVGRLPKLRQLCIRPGVYFWKLPIHMLTTLLRESPAQLNTVHIQDLEFRAQEDHDFSLLADHVAALPQLKQFTIAHCRFCSTAISLPVLDPLMGALLKKNTVEKIVISATRVNNLGGPLLTDTLQDIFVSGQPHSILKELRLIKFAFSSETLMALFATLLVRYPCLEKLVLSSCQEWNAASIRVLSQLLIGSNTNHANNGHNNNLREVHLLGACEYLETNEECHLELADALQRSSVRRFFLEPLQQRRTNRIDEEQVQIPHASQKAYVQRMEHNYSLEEYRLVGMFAPQWQACMEFYVRLNIAGRRDVFFVAQEQDGYNRSDKVPWVNAIAAVNDDVACIFYFLLHNPSLCAIYLLQYELRGLH